MSKKTERAAKGGKARAESLTPEQRSESARHAARAMWAARDGDTILPRETHPGVLKIIPDRDIPCSVLDNGMRVFSTRGLTRAMGYTKTGTARDRSDGDTGAPQLPPFLVSASIKPYISADLMARLARPIAYKPKHGGRAAFGYEATILSAICWAVIDANRAKPLHTNQQGLVMSADLLVRGFGDIGIIALIDEATGYQAERVRDELQTILQAYIAKELLQWTKKFPDEFFRQIYRLQSWEYKEGSVARPGYVGKLINKYVYERLPPGVLDELRKKNPPVNGRRQFKHFQFLTEQTGHPHLDKQIASVTTLMRAARNKDEFSDMFLRAYPMPGDQTAMVLDPNED